MSDASTQPPGGEAPPRLSTRVYLFGLVVAVLVPVLVFATVVVVRYASEERARYERVAVQIARQAGLLVDGELTQYAAMLKGLASSSALARNDLADFYVQAKRLVDGRDEVIVLRDLGMRQLVNTQVPFGAQLPPAVPIPADNMAALSAGRELVSQVYRSPISGEPRVAVALGAHLDGAAGYVLAITFPTSRIRDVLLPAIPQEWIVAIGDRQGIIVARSERHVEFTGKPGLPEYLAKATGSFGNFTSLNFDGRRVLSGYYRSELSGWLTGANVPEDVVEAPLRRSLSALVALGVSALALSALLAYLFGTTFSAAAAGLAERAAALGEGRPVARMTSRLKEFSLVSDALAGAAAAVQQRGEERRRSEEQRQLLINELNHRVKNTLATVQSIVRQTLAEATSMPEATDALTDRLIALAKAHDVLTRESWQGADLRDIVADATRPYTGADRIVSRGPPVWLTPSLSLSLALVLHELATNASKYGSLSAREGTVEINWELGKSADATLLRLQWIERGGPRVAPPTRKGFGTRLIERGLPTRTGGSVKVDYKPEGVICLIDVPIDETGDSSPAHPREGADLGATASAQASGPPLARQ